MENLEHVFAGVRQSLNTLYLGLADRLGEPCNEEQLRTFEQKAGILLPEPVRQLYGQADGCKMADGLFGGWEWLTLAFVEDHLLELDICLESDRPDEAAAKSLIPIFHANGDYLCVRREEDSGRLYYVPHDDDTVKPVTASLVDFLEQFITRIASKALTLNEYHSPRGTYFSLRPPNREYWPPAFD